MATLFRHTPTAARATELRVALSAAGIKARVAKQSYALRIVSDLNDVARAAEVAIGLGFGGPCGGEPARSNTCLFAYDFRGEA
jgi:hypothetical protein